MNGPFWDAAKLAEKTADCYSFDRYANWTAVLKMLRKRGYTEREAEAIVRSKFARWAGDMSSNRYGRCTSADLARFLDGIGDRLAAEVAELVRGTFGG